MTLRIEVTARLTGMDGTAIAEVIHARAVPAPAGEEYDSEAAAARDEIAAAAMILDDAIVQARDSIRFQVTGINQTLGS